MTKVYEHAKVKYLPWFMRPKYLVDKNKVLSISGDINYDPSSMHIPIEEYKFFTPTMIQFWNFKKDNFDKIICFKLGKFYEIFYDDAIACHLLFNLNWMGGCYKVHVGFPETMLMKVGAKLINNGF